MQVILILAAGASSRMGGADKLLEPVRGVPLLRDRVTTAMATGCPVHVTLPVHSPKRRAALGGLDVALVPVEGTGMGASLAAGIASLPAKAMSVLVVLADMPDITNADMKSVLRADDGGEILRGADENTPGHPVLFPRQFFAELRMLVGDDGAKQVIKSAGKSRLIPLPDRHALTDLDTPEDWADWRAR